MNLNHLGEQIDIHGGGNDLIFPHHENEIAQTETLTGKPFARYWVHNGMLQLSGEKMSKSLGNMVTINQFLAEHEADVLRILVLNSSYRGPLTYNEEVVAGAERALERLRSAMRPALSASDTSSAASKSSLDKQVELSKQGFIEAMDDDFNSAGALGQLFDLVRAVNQARDAGAGTETLTRAQAELARLTGVLGLHMEKPEKIDSDAGPFIDLLIEIRRELRSQKLWALSDQVRNGLAELGVLIEDGKEGTTWRYR